MIKYKIYPTLLDAYQWYLESESDEALKDLLNKINRVPFTSEAAAKGTAFNNAVDLLKGKEIPSDEYYTQDGFEFRTDILKEFVSKFSPAVHQVYTEAILPTSKGDVLLYGFCDEVMAYKGHDIKTTGSYDFPKYTRNMQHLVYPYCFNQSGVKMDSFEYNITNFSSIYAEEYVYNAERDTQRLVNICERFIEFLELVRDDITDKKIFNLSNNVIVASLDKEVDAIIVEGGVQ
jgi:hypothetical protein